MKGWKQSTEETMDKATFIWNMLMGVTNGDPQEAIEILSAVHVSLWLSGKADDGKLDEMLTSFCSCVKVNVEAAERSRLQ